MRRAAIFSAVMLAARLADAAPQSAAETVEASPAQPTDSRPETLIDERRVVELALADHPTIQAAIEAKRAAEAGYDAAQRARIPDLSVSARYARLSSIPARYRSFDGFTFPQLLDQLGARAELSVPLSNAFLGLAAAARAAGREAEAREIEIVSTRAQVTYEARVAFLQYWSMKLALENAQRSRTRSISGTAKRQGRWRRTTCSSSRSPSTRPS